ncbi:MAG: hypothetical protein EOO48_06020 [Flavobacterium sp.]|nr:MAG: hypothetical protein EOO48_06020 [Flavobacterium sp.]
MITSLFRKSTPLNYAFIIIAVGVFYFLYQFGHISTGNGLVGFAQQIGLLVVIYASFFIVNFIVKKNHISRDSSYAALFFLLFILFFPSILDDPNMVLANFFILLALRRLISLHSPKASKEKIFDASLWIFVAALFHFWAILFIVLVFISIIFHVSRDYRNWVLPFIAFFTSAAAFLLYAFVFDDTLIADLIAKTQTNFALDYFTSNRQNVALSIYTAIALYFVGSMVLSLSNRPLQLQSSYKKIIASFFIGVIIFVISPVKSNDVLIFTIAPLTFMANAQVEFGSERLKEDITLTIVIICSVYLFFSQL